MLKKCYKNTFYVLCNIKITLVRSNSQVLMWWCLSSRFGLLNIGHDDLGFEVLCKIDIQPINTCVYVCALHF